MSAEHKDSTSQLLEDLQILDQLLTSDEQDNIPLLNDLVEHSDDVIDLIPTLEPEFIPELHVEPEIIPQVEPEPISPPKKENPFLPKAVLERLAQERLAAQHSAEEAHRTMQRVNEQKQNRARDILNDMGKQLTTEQKDELIRQLADEMLPQIAERLKEKLQVMLGR